MRITRLHVRNFRVYEHDLDLELPPGLVGIYGVNGSGKSTLLDAIRWALWGQARTPKDEIRTSGVNADCLAELEFEHEGHLYLVRRTQHIDELESLLVRVANPKGNRVVPRGRARPKD